MGATESQSGGDQLLPDKTDDQPRGEPPDGDTSSRVPAQPQGSYTEAVPAGESDEPDYPADPWPLLPDEDEPKEKWHRQALYSVWLYMLVVTTVVGVCCWAVLKTHLLAVDIGAGIVIVCAGGLIILRLVRGSVPDARRRVRKQLEDGQPVPSDRLRTKLYRHEELYWESRLHPISIVPEVTRRFFASRLRRWLLGAYLIALGITFTTHRTASLWLLVLLGGAVVLAVLEWGRTRYAVTNQRILAVTGLFSTDVPFMPRSKMTDVKVHTPWFANWLAWLRLIDVPWGTWDVETAGQDQALKYIYYVVAAQEVVAALGIGSDPNAAADGT